MGLQEAFKGYGTFLLSAALAAGTVLQAQQKNAVSHSVKTPHQTQPLSSNQADALNTPLAYLHTHDFLPLSRALDPKAFMQTLLNEIDADPGRIDDFVKHYAQIKKIIGQDNAVLVRDHCYVTGLDLLEKLNRTRDQPTFIIDMLNAMHDDPAEIRFAPLKELAISNLFQLSIENRAYPSAYRGIFDEIERQAKANGGTLPQLIEMAANEYPLYLQTILLAAADHGKLDAFLTGASPPQINKIMKVIGEEEAWADLQSKDPYTQYGVIKNLFVINEIGLSVARIGSPEAKKAFIENVMKLADAHESIRTRVMLGSFLSQYGRLDPVTLAANPDAQKLADANPINVKRSMSHDDLFAQNGKIGKLHVSAVYFYSDATEQINDGDYYYHQYVKELHQSKQWRQVEEQEKILVMERTNPENGLKILRIIGKPIDGSPQAVKDYINAHGLQKNSHIERGHIFHIKVSKDSDEVKDLSLGDKPILVWIGGCGAYMYTNDIGNQNLGAEITLNDSTGMANDNTALMNAGDDIILSGKDLVYKDLMEDAAKSKYGPQLDGYMTPDMNPMILIGVMRNKFLEAETQEEVTPVPPEASALSVQVHALLNIRLRNSEALQLR